jgi:hypothetical protein
MGRQSREAKRTRDQGFLRGMKKHPRTIQRIGSLDEAGVIALLEDHLASLDALEEATAHHAECVQRERALEKRVLEISGNVKGLAHATHGENPAALGDFGLALYRKTGPKTPEVVEAAIAKAKATRAARFSMGKRQKAAIRGTTGGG